MDKKKLAKKLGLAALALALAAGASLGYKHHREGQPYLVGRCFVDKQNPAMLAVVESQKLPTREGKEVLAYLTVIVLDSPMGQISLDGPALEVREANKGLREAVQAGKLKELNCETGEEIK